MKCHCDLIIVVYSFSFVLDFCNSKNN